MSESVIADFVAKFNTEATAGPPIKGRILLSQKRLVLAANDEDRLTIPLDTIFDVAVGQVPPDLGDFFDSTVTVAFEKRDRRFVAAIEAGEEKIDKFSTLLFKTLLNGTEMTIKHPARRGGRVTDEAFTPARLYLEPRVVTFKNDAGSVDINLSEVTDFDRATRKIGGSSRSVLVIRHMPAGEALTTLAATKSSRKMSILGRYVRLEYSELMNEIKDTEITADEKEILVAVYSGAGAKGMSLSTVVDLDPSQLTMLLNKLEEKELLVTADGGQKLSPKGQVIVSNHLEDVNA